MCCLGGASSQYWSTMEEDGTAAVCQGLLPVRLVDSFWRRC
jgi:hypothetical protein